VMKTYCQPVFVAPFGHVTSISVVGFHVGFTFAHIPPSEAPQMVVLDKIFFFGILFLIHS